MSAKLRLVPRNFLDLMTTITGSVAPATGFEYANMLNTRRSSFWRSPDATAQSVTFSMPSGTVKCNCFFMFRHRCHGGTIRVRGYSGSGATGSVLFDTNTLGPTAVYTPVTTGYDHGYTDHSSLDTHDPFGLESPYSAYFAGASGVASVLLELSSKSTTYGYNFWEVCRPYLGMYKEFAYQVPYDGYGLGRAENSKKDRSLGGSMVPYRGARWNVLTVNTQWLSEEEIATSLDFMDQCQTSGDVVVSVFPGDGGRSERDAVINGTFEALDLVGRADVFSLEGTKKIQIVGN